MSEIRRLASCIAGGGLFATPVGAPTTTTIAVIQDIVATTGHVVHNSISVDTNASSSASLDHVPELFARATSSLEFVGSGLVVEPPGVELSTLRPAVGEDGLADGEDLDAHPALLGKILALFLNVSMRPTEHLNNGTLLAFIIDVRLVNSSALPDEVDGLKLNLIAIATIRGTDGQAERSITERRVGLILAAVL